MEGEPKEVRDRVFVSYRRSVDLAAARQVVLSLRQRLEEDQLFYAELDSSIPPVSRWKDQIDKGLDSAAVFVLVMGPDWLDELKRRETDGKTDYQLYEIARALEEDLPIVWVLMDGAGDRPPEPDDLPEEVRALCSVQAFDLPQRHFHHLVDPLVERIVELLDGATASGGRNGRRRSVPGAELLVGPLETGAPYREIADAVEVAAAGSIVRVLPGTYRKPVVVREPITILGAGPDETVLKTPGVCLDVTADDVAIGQVGVLLDSKDGGIGVRVSAAEVLIDGCDVAGGLAPGSTGIHVTESARSAVVRSTHVHHLTIGIDFAGAEDHRVEDCRLSNLDETGILACATVHVSDCDFKRIPHNAVVAATGGEVVVERARFAGKDRRYRCNAGGRLLVRGARGRAGAFRETALAFNMGAIDKFDLSAVRERHRRGEKVRLSDTFTGGTDGVFIVVDGGAAEVHESDLGWVSVDGGGTVRLLDCEAAEVAVSSASEIEIVESSVERIRASAASTVTLRRSTVRPVWKDNKLGYHPPAISMADGSFLRIVDGSDIDTAHRNNFNGGAECAGVVANDSSVEVDGSKVLGLRAAALNQVGGSLTLHDAQVDCRSQSGLTLDVSRSAVVVVAGTSVTGRVAFDRSRTTGTDSTFKGGVSATNSVVDLTDCRIETELLSGTFGIDGGDVSCTGGAVGTPIDVKGHDVRLRASDVSFNGDVRITAVGSVEMTKCRVSKALSVVGDHLDVVLDGGDVRSLTIGASATVRDCTVRDVAVGPVSAELVRCELLGRLTVDEGGSADLLECVVRAGRVVIGSGGVAVLRGCQVVDTVAKGDGPNDAGLVVAEHGALEVVGGEVASPQQIKAPTIRLRRATKEKAERLAGLGGARVLSVHAGGTAHFEQVAFSDLGSDPVLLAAGSEVRFEDCTLDGAPWEPGRWPRRPQ